MFKKMRYAAVAAATPPTHSTIAEQLRECMHLRGLSAMELSKLAGVKPSFIYDILHGKSTNPSSIKLAMVAQALGISLSDLLESEPFREETEEETEARRRRQAGGDYVTVPSLVVGGLAGNASVVTRELESEPYFFHKSWVEQKLKVNPEDLRMIFVRGDSMASTLLPGDMILLDLTKTNPSPPGVYVLFDGYGLIVKRLELVANTTPPSVRVTSDNTQYDGYDCPIDELNIIGKVVWFAREM